MRQKGPGRDVEKQRFWQRHVGRWRQSGRSIRDYCRENALSEPSFYAWRRELARRRQVRRDAGSRPKASQAAAASFLPVRVVEGPAAETTGGVEIVWAHGRTVRVQAGFDRQALAEVLAVLEARPC